MGSLEKITEDKRSVLIAKEIVNRIEETSDKQGGKILQNNQIKIITFNYTNSLTKLIEIEVSKAIKRGESQLEWCTPSGFVVTQKLMKKLFKDVELQLLGRVKIRVSIGDDDKVDLNHHKNATAPNVIHSLDASLLHLSALRFDAPLSLIHDSVLCRATDMTALSTIVREVYMHLFAEHDYLKEFAKQIGAETEPPIIGDLKPESVIESTYFFC